MTDWDLAIFVLAVRRRVNSPFEGVGLADGHVLFHSSQHW